MFYTKGFLVSRGTQKKTRFDHLSYSSEKKFKKYINTCITDNQSRDFQDIVVQEPCEIKCCWNN